MKPVKISFNRQMHHPTAGTYYRGCFSLPRHLFEKFTNQKGTGNSEHFLKVTETKELIRFLKFNRVPFDERRAHGVFNYYINIVD